MFGKKIMTPRGEVNLVQEAKLAGEQAQVKKITDLAMKVTELIWPVLLQSKLALSEWGAFMKALATLLDNKVNTIINSHTIDELAGDKNNLPDSGKEVESNDK